jgi:hypothetical protein
VDRPSIIHLLGWTACTAVVLFVWQVHIQDDPNLRPLGQLIVTLIHAMALGAALGVLVMTLIRRWRGQVFPTQPGEWFLVAYASGEALVQVYTHVVNQMSVPRSEIDHNWMAFGNIVLITIPYVVALIHGGGGINWRAIFIMLVVIQAAYLIPSVAQLISSDSDLYTSVILRWFVEIKPFAWLVVSVIAIGIDIGRKMERGWVHNVGAVVLIVLPCLDLAQRVVWQHYWQNQVW